jgi:hypothetical protein
MRELLLNCLEMQAYTMKLLELLSPFSINETNCVITVADEMPVRCS